MSKAQRIENTKQAKSMEEKAKLTAEFNHLNIELEKLDKQVLNINIMRDEMAFRLEEIWDQVDEMV